MTYYLQYLGNTLDEGTSQEMVAAKELLVKKIMSNELPDFLTTDDFDNYEDCFLQFKIVTLKEDK
jgi:hypothetical protein